MRRGPLPRPDSKRSRAGQYFKSYGTKEKGRVLPPTIVRKDPRALAFWKKHAPTLIADGRLKPSQVDAFGMLCIKHSMVEYLLQLFNEQGPTFTDSLGKVLMNPVAVRLDRAQVDFFNFSKEFGMTTASMARLPGETASGEEDEGEALLKKFTG